MSKSELLESLAEALEDLGTGHLVVITGAGISLASGIPTFRGNDPDAVWKKDITELGTYGFFREDPVTSWRWSMDLFSKIPAARPNPAHVAVAELGRWHRRRGGRFTLVTQNVDTLHEQAGDETLLRDLVKVHGTVDRVRCASRRGCEHGAPSGSLPREAIDIEGFLADPSPETLPRCPACGDLVRQHVLWFDEFYAEHDDYQWPRVQSGAQTLDLALFVGTSFAVGVTEIFLQASLGRRRPTFSIDPAGIVPYPGVGVVAAKAEEALPELGRRLGFG